MSVTLAVPTLPALAKPVAAAQPPKPSPGRAVSGVKPSAYRFTEPHNDAKVPHQARATNLPKAASAAVNLVDAAGKPAGKTRAAGTPVWARAMASSRGYTGPAQATVQVLDQQTAQKAGVSGAVLKVTPEGGASGEVQIGVDYRNFAEAYGGNYGSRLQLVQLPACALTTPEVAACRTRTPLKSSNDVKTHAVSAEINFKSNKLTTSSSRPSGARNSTALYTERSGSATAAAMAESSAVVLAATTSIGGEGGSYAATDLKPSGSWSGGGSTGSYTYNYPITTPPTAGGLEPSLALSYDSGSVDGQTTSTQAQSSWVGDGWGTPRSFIEQTFVSCADDPQGKAAPEKTSDLCYSGPLLTLSLNGSSSALVYDDTANVWKPKADNGEVITHSSKKLPGADPGHWTVVTRDGTTYHFGLNKLPGYTAGKDTTNSVDTVPVFSAHSTDPCYKAEFKNSWCDMASRWSLDYVVDVNGNAMSYYYKQDTNRYGRFNGDTDYSYVRDSHLDHIDYGFRAGDAYGTVPNKVEFTPDDRCISGTCQPLNKANKANWPDVPYDLVCAPGTDCETWAPSFFSTVRLTAITTKQYSTASKQYVPVDSYALSQKTPATGDGNSPTLWLESITRTGHDTTTGGSTSAIALPPVQFASVKLPNRVDTLGGLSSFNRHRIQSITTETGSVITVGYELPKPCIAGSTPSPASNTSSCYPVQWTPDGFTAPKMDWFNKYAVTRVTATDPTGGSLATATSYLYLDGAAWHYDDNETVKAKHRTYGQFRGYKRVQTFEGDGVNNPRTKSESTFYRGMSKNNNTTVATVTDSLGGVHEDHDALAGKVLETTNYQGEDGAPDGSTITAYWISTATATRARTGLPALTANWVAPAVAVSKQRTLSTGSTVWRYQQTDHSYDATIGSATIGLLKATYSHTVPADSAHERCTTFTYTKSGSIVGLVAETETVAVACGGFITGSPISKPAKYNSLTLPAMVSRPAQVVSAQRYFYDDTTFSTTFPQAITPTRGLTTMIQKATDHSNGAYTFQTSGRTTYDLYGRPVDSYDAKNNLTKTAYTSNPVGLPTGATVTASLGHTTSFTSSPMRGTPLTSTDINGVVVRQQSDALGRVTGVWLNNRATTAPANYKFSYTVSNTGITATTAEVANDSNGYLKTVSLYDAMLRPRQTQIVTPQGGRMVSDTFYDTRGWASASYNGWWDPATLPTVGPPVTAEDLRRNVPNQTFTTYDGLGRAVIVESAQNNLTVSKTITVHEGDRTTVIPPAGGTVTSTSTDPVGRTTALTEYKTRPTVITPANTFTGTFRLQIPAGDVAVTSSYKYNQRGDQDKVVDAKGNPWTSTFNMLGQVTSRADPDAGTTTGMEYDANGNLLQSTDARGKTISSTYDELNRQTGTYAADTDAQNSSNQLTKLIYDNSDAAMTNTAYVKGKLTTAISYTGGKEYKLQARGFNIFGKSTSETFTIPASEGALAGDYTVAHTYSTGNGLPLKDIYPAKGGLPAEAVLASYDSFDRPYTLGGANGYAQGVTYDAYGRVNQQTIGSAPNLSSVTNTYDEHRGKLTEQLVTRTPTLSNVHQQKYQYDLVGNLIRQTTNRLLTGRTETQCFGYDTLRRLAEAWTATDECAAAPTDTDRSNVGNTIGAGTAYWTSWVIDDLGNRTSQIERSLTGGTDTSTAYRYNGNGADQVHTLTSTETTGGRTGTTSYTYDIAGNTKTRTTAGGTQNLSWNDVGKLAAVTTPAGTTTNIYSYTGDLLIEKSPGTTTLYLGSQQFALNTTTNTVTGTRYYALPGGGSVIRTGTGNNYTFALADHHGTPDFYLDSTAQTPSWRQYTPYGDPRGNSITIPDNRTFLNKTFNSATGLIQVGARQYDASIGRFISVDPLQDLTDAQQWNGYNYANNSPTTRRDPSGLLNPCGGDDVPCKDIPKHPIYHNGGDSGGSGGSGSNGGGKGSGGSGGGVASGDNDPVVLSQPLKDAMKGGPYNYQGDVYTRKSLTDFAAESPANRELLCVHLNINNQAACDWQNQLVPGEPMTTQDLIDLGMELSGLADARDCKNGKISGCGWLLLGFAPVGKFGKFLKGTFRSGKVANAAHVAAEVCTWLKSFDGDTQVLMADGSTKKISELRVGDWVLATDPETGESGPRQIKATWVHDDDLYVMNIDGHPLITTEDHPFWNETDRQWQEAEKIDVGDRVATSIGTAPVNGFDKAGHRRAPAYNLTVNDLHAYYVLAGNEPVLVHNCNLDNVGADELYNVATEGGSYRKAHRAGESVQKHSDPTRSAAQREMYDYGAKNPTERNFVGQTLLEEILTDPNARRKIDHNASAHYGGSTLEIWTPNNGIGARWSMRGGNTTFEGFIDARRY
ncbi:polymorphic toxin-type HINT domain-containing protein [Actinoplanes xinjiangensis]|uniref:polymorphic toxin-type HINT domain-containing protein n=1 Tax=Actinoplanes xinjiangensis TaxID=512350 RepID=UPI0034213C78